MPVSPAEGAHVPRNRNPVRIVDCNGADSVVGVIGGRVRRRRRQPSVDEGGISVDRLEDLAEHVVSRLGDDPSRIGDGLNVTRGTVSITCNKGGIGRQGDGRRTRVNRVSVGSDVDGRDQSIRGVVIRRGVVNESGDGADRLKVSELEFRIEIIHLFFNISDF